MLHLGKTYWAYFLISATLLVSAMFLPSGALWANESVRGSLPTPADRQAKIPTFLAKNYYFAKVTRSYPTEGNRQSLDAEGVGYGLGYTFTIRQQYLVSLVAGFHSLYHIPSDSAFSYFTVYNESLRLLRLYHPVYATVGGRVGYMVPTLASGIPLKQNTAFENEIMVGGSGGLALVLAKDILVGTQLAMWGGTNSSKHRIIDFSVNLRVAL